jgi:phosphomannomutase
MDTSIFRAYDIRGIYPEQINEEVAYKIAQAYSKFLNPKTIALGMDVRLSSPKLFDAVKRGLVDHGVNVVSIGVISTDMLYFAVAEYGYDGGITVSASHNPKEYNGLKLVCAKAVPISSDSGIMEIKEIVASGYLNKAETPGQFAAKDITNEYLKKCLSFVDVGKIKPLRVVANAMFGPALLNVQLMNLPVQLIMLNEDPDGSFPKGQPDPLQIQNQQETIELIRETHPDFGVAWDADADRCFFFDEKGRFIFPYYISLFLAEYFCRKEPGAKIVHDLRLVRGLQERVGQLGGELTTIKAGRSYFNPAMTKLNAIFGAETSGHYYFRDFYSADNGLVPFLIMLQIVSQSDKKMSELFDEYFEKYPISGEVNYKLTSPDELPTILQKIEAKFADATIDKTDGLSIEYPDWRANIRGSNTEAMLRLNVEAKDPDLLKEKTEELTRLCEGSLPTDR